MTFDKGTSRSSPGNRLGWIGMWCLYSSLKYLFFSVSMYGHAMRICTTVSSCRHIWHCSMSSFPSKKLAVMCICPILSLHKVTSMECCWWWHIVSLRTMGFTDAAYYLYRSPTLPASFMTRLDEYYAGCLWREYCFIYWCFALLDRRIHLPGILHGIRCLVSLHDLARSKSAVTV